MRARTWIVVGLFAMSAVIARRGTDPRAHDGAAAAPHPAAHGDGGDRPTLAWHELPELPELPDEHAPPVAVPSVIAPQLDDPAEAAARLGIELDDAPSNKPSPPTADPRFEASLATLEGTVRDLALGEPMAGVVVVATSPVAAQEETALTDETGAYRFAGMQPGEYTLTFYDLDVTMVRPGIMLEAGWTHIEPVVLEPAEPAPLIDASDRNIPVPGRTFDEVLGAAAGEQHDSYGVTFTGVTSLENTYYLDGETREQ